MNEKTSNDKYNYSLTPELNQKRRNSVNDIYQKNNKYLESYEVQKKRQDSPNNEDIVDVDKMKIIKQRNNKS